jgi:hypothetical protein
LETLILGYDNQPATGFLIMGARFPVAVNNFAKSGIMLGV